MSGIGVVVWLSQTVCVCVCVRERERERNSERDRDRGIRVTIQWFIYEGIV